MKNLRIALLLFVVLLGCGNMSANQDTKGEVIHLTKEQFMAKVMNYKQNPDKWVYLGDKPCLIDFYATWCGPCKRLGPVLDELAAEYGDQIYIYKVDVDQERQLAALFQVSSVPTLVFCPMGENPQLAKGALPKETLCEIIEKVLLK